MENRKWMSLLNPVNVEPEFVIDIELKQRSIEKKKCFHYNLPFKAGFPETSMRERSEIKITRIKMLSRFMVDRESSLNTIKRK